MSRRYTLTIADRSFRVGRIQKQIRRCLIALDRPATIRDLLEWCYPRLTEFRPWHRTNVHRAVPKFAVPVGPTRERFASLWTLAPNGQTGAAEKKD
jgi:hypothetical protein